MTDANSTVVEIAPTPTAIHEKDNELAACQAKLAVQESKDGSTPPSHSSSPAIPQNKDIATEKTVPKLLEKYTKDREIWLKRV